MAETSRTAGMIEKVQIGNTAHSIASTAYGVCDTTSGVTEKTVAMTGFVLYEGVTVHVKFLNTNSVASPTLNVNGTGAKEIKLYGTTAAGTNAEREGWQAGAVVSFTYDGTYWIRDQGYNTNTTYTIKDTYSGTDGNPISGKGVKAALQTLDGNLNNTTPAASKTLTAFSETDGIVSATFGNIQIGESQVTNLTTHLGEKAPIASPTFTGTVTLPGAPTADLQAATKKYVDDKTAGLSGAMHFKGTTTTTMSDGLTTAAVTIGGSSYTPSNGDVVLYSGKEYVWTGTLWEELGDESSFIRKTLLTTAGDMIYASSANTPARFAGNSTTTLQLLSMTSSTPAWKTLGLNAGTWPTVSITKTVKFLKTATLQTGTAFTVPNVTSAGSMTNASVTNAILTITNGSAPTLGTAFTIPNATGVSTTSEEALTNATINTTSAAWPTLKYT